MRRLISPGVPPSPADAFTRPSSEDVPEESETRIRVAEPVAEVPKAVASGGKELRVEFDALNESVVIGAMLVSRPERARLLRLIPPDTFLVPQYAAACRWLKELERRDLDYDPATIKQIAGSEVDIDLLEAIRESRPDIPPNIEHHIRSLFWDRRRATTLEGPVAALLEALRDPRCEPSRAEAIGRQVAASLAGGGESRRFLRNGPMLAREQAEIIRLRAEGEGNYPYGIDGIDYYESAEAAKTFGRYDVGRYPEGTRFRRALPGTAPGKTTLLSAVTGGFKTTIAAGIIFSLMMKRKILCAAWEPGAGMSLELLGCIMSGVRRGDLISGQATKAERDVHAASMQEIVKYVKFMDNPFLDEGSKDRWHANEENIDLFTGYIADAGCDLVVCDLWNRMLSREDPSEEAKALWRQQAIFAKLGVHGIMLHQMRFKDVETRVDKKPTREGMKGSGAYVEVPDTVIGTHFPAMWKAVDPNRLEVFFLKQRYGVWPLGVELDLDASIGRVSGGRSIPYDQPTGAENDGDTRAMRAKPRTRKW